MFSNDCLLLDFGLYTDDLAKFTFDPILFLLSCGDLRGESFILFFDRDIIDPLIDLLSYNLIVYFEPNGGDITDFCDFIFIIGIPGFYWLLSTDPLCPNDCLANIPPVIPNADANKFFL